MFQLSSPAVWNLAVSSGRRRQPHLLLSQGLRDHANFLCCPGFLTWQFPNTCSSWFVPGRLLRSWLCAQLVSRPLSPFVPGHNTNIDCKSSETLRGRKAWSRRGFPREAADANRPQTPRPPLRPPSPRCSFSSTRHRKDWQSVARSGRVQLTSSRLESRRTHGTHRPPALFGCLAAQPAPLPDGGHSCHMCPYMLPHAGIPGQSGKSKTDVDSRIEVCSYETFPGIPSRLRLSCSILRRRARRQGHPQLLPPDAFVCVLYHETPDRDCPCVEAVSRPSALCVNRSASPRVPEKRSFGRPGKRVGAHDG